MRLTDEQIRQGVLHPDVLARDVVLDYFGQSFSDDEAVLPLSLRAAEQYGEEDAFLFPHKLASLAQTAETLDWSIRKLSKADEPPEDPEAYWPRALSEAVSRADAALLARREEEVLALPGLRPDHREAVRERVRLLEADAEDCWGELQRFCEEGKSVDYLRDVDLPHAHRLVEAIARSAPEGSFDERLLDILSRHLEDEEYEDNPFTWLEPLAARLAGELRLGAAVPLLAGKLREDGGDLMNEECERAFVRIGVRSNEAVEQITRDFPDQPWHYRLYASGAMEYMHTDFVVARSQALREQEEDRVVRTNLIAAVLGSFCSEGVEPAAELVRAGDLELREMLLGVATLMDEAPGELEEWKRQERVDRQITIERIRALTSREPPEPPKPSRPLLGDALAPVMPAPIFGAGKVGRNDPCPCGSGKKYKKCCMQKGP